MAKVDVVVSPFEEIEICKYEINCSKGLIPVFDSSHKSRAIEFICDAHKEYIAKKCGFDSYKQMDTLLKASGNTEQTMVKLWKQTLGLEDVPDELLTSFISKDNLFSPGSLNGCTFEFDSDSTCRITVHPNSTIALDDRDDLCVDLMYRFSDAIAEFAHEFVEYIESICNDADLIIYYNKASLHYYEATIRFFTLKDVTCEDIVFLITKIEWPDSVLSFVEFINRFSAKVSESKLTNNLAREYDKFNEYRTYADPVKIYAMNKYGIDIVGKYGCILTDGYEILELKIPSPQALGKFFEDYGDYLIFVWDNTIAEDPDDVEISRNDILSY